MKRPLKFNILGKSWTIEVLTKKRYKRKHGKDSVGITTPDKRKIEISPYGFDRETVIHELVHAYIAEMCLHSCDLDDDNLEEVFAELMSKRGFELLALSDDLYWKLNV